MLMRLLAEPPFRIFTRAALKYLPTSLDTKVKWELSTRPAYLLGVYEAAKQAKREGKIAIEVIEFGVAGGTGLLELQRIAEMVERETGVFIKVIGFDMGNEGLPSFIGDHRDHPDQWKPGDFKMDEEALRAKLDPHRITLLIGNVSETVFQYARDIHENPVGFISFDMDLYSSTRDALKIFSCTDVLAHVPLYFDDIEFIFNYSEAGELAAIEEYNGTHWETACIDQWYGIKEGRPFPERGFLEKMRVHHSFSDIENIALQRESVHLPLS